ncbi:MAG: EscI/YscI/HrpB family type III secretion system inner rod protein [Allorhizobium sp.]
MVSPILGAVPLHSAQPAVLGVAPADRVAAFDQALAREELAQAQASAPAQPPANVAPASDTQVLSPADRARAGLDLAPAASASAPAPGNMILDGLTNLRGVFDAREARVGEIMKRSGTDATSLMELQVEVVNFTMLVDISSKLTGKTTQVFDTLMKGQ